jgi:cobalt-zinc-cadmium efflux system outer membrane protein
VGLAALFGAITLATPAGAQQIGLEEALRLALERHPDLRVAEAESRAAEGEVRGARTYPFNPEVSASAGRETNPGDPERASAYEFSLDQTLEIGKRGPRIAAAEARLAAAQARADQVRLSVLAGARRAYLLALADGERLATAREAEAVAGELRGFAAERLSLGAGTQLESNVAAAAAGRARIEPLAAERRRRLALAALAAAIGAPPGELPEPMGAFPSLPPPPGTADELVQRALAQHPDLRATRQERLAAASDLALARRLGRPDPTLGVRLGRASHPPGEGSPQERTLFFGLTLPLPLFNRNQGGVAVAQALENRTNVVEQAQERRVEREARAAYDVYRIAHEAARGFDRDVTDRIHENLELARESLRAGKISLLEFNVVRRDLVDARLGYLDALADLVEARSALELAVGGSLE